MKLKVGTDRRFRLCEFFLILAITLKPLYLGESGGVQISDFCFLFLFLSVFLYGFRTYTNKTVKNWLILVAGTLLYQMVVSLIWQFITDNKSISGNLLVSQVYYLFNFLIVFSIIKMNNIVPFEKIAKDCGIGAALSCIVCMVGMLLNPVSGIRQIGFFNNPNQLGYFSVIIFTWTLVLKDYINVKLRWFISISSCFFVVLSMSKAAIISVALLLFLTFFLNQVKKLTIKKCLLRALAIIGFCLMVYGVLYSDWSLFTSNQTITTMRHRMLTMFTESDSALGSGRGYDRINEIGLNVLWGVGEGKFQRFLTMPGYETHSSYASLIISYGIVGLLLYGLIFYKALYKKNYKYRFLLLFSGILFYGLTHNGLRHTLLWTIIAIILLWPQNTEDKLLLNDRINDKIINKNHLLTVKCNSFDIKNS